MICYIVFCVFPRICLRNGQGVFSPVSVVMNVLFESTQALGFLCVLKSIEFNELYTPPGYTQRTSNRPGHHLVPSYQHTWMSNCGFPANDRYRYLYIWLK